MRRGLTNYEQETIINFNKAEDIAHIFTYEKTWQKHLEGKLGLKPVMENGFGGKEYELPKSRIKPPRAPVRLSAEARAKRGDRLRQSRVVSARKPNAMGNQTKEKRNKGGNPLRHDIQRAKEGGMAGGMHPIFRLLEMTPLPLEQALLKRLEGRYTIPATFGLSE